MNLLIDFIIFRLIMHYLFALNNILNKKIDKKTRLNKIKILYN